MYCISHVLKGAIQLKERELLNQNWIVQIVWIAPSRSENRWQAEFTFNYISSRDIASEGGVATHISTSWVHNLKPQF